MKSIFRTGLVAFSGFLAGVVLLYILHMRNRPDLQVWHLANLDQEVTASDIEQMENLDDYINQEQRLFQQLEKEVFIQVNKQDHLGLNRYAKESWSNPNRFKQNWNRTVELPVQSPQAGILMLHGLSDSPYSMRSTARSLHNRQSWVIALRLPGHGTAPAGLSHVKWQDFSSAVRLAARHLREKIGPDAPFYIVGYSNGAALALEYTLSEMLGEKLHRPAGLVLISPAVSVSPTAFLAKWHGLLANLPGLEKLSWLNIKREYDPYKYNSFAVNAGDQIHKLTKRIDGQLKKLGAADGIDNFPPVLAVQSAVDATLPAAAMIEKFMKRLSPNGHKLILFDINRVAADMVFLKNTLEPTIEKMMSEPLPFTLSLVTNDNKSSKYVEIREKRAREKVVKTEKLNLIWPDGVYSLSHVALPFPTTDPLYGRPSGDAAASITLGSLEARGEKGILEVPLTDLMRLRYNPFYSYMEEQVHEWIFAETRDN